MARRSSYLGMLVAVCMMFAATAGAAPILVSTQGVFSDPNQVFEQSFSYDPITMGGTIIIQSLGYGGSANGSIVGATGTNLAGTVISPGGFDPIVALYAGGAGAGGARITFNDDGTCGPRRGTTSAGICFDSTIEISGLSAGMYTIALTTFPNFPPSTETGSYPGAGSFNGRTSAFAVDAAAVPEPATLTLFGTGIAALVARRRKKHNA